MQCWLFKTEPDVYSIDDLAREKNQTVRWDGIRNYQARNLLRDQVAVGDLVFLYHSSCKAPGIAGTAKVVSAPYPDPTQFDPESPYRDVKSAPDKPRWVSVDIQLVKRFADVVTGKKLKELPGLENMVLFKQGRLSIQPVTKPEWQQITAYIKQHTS